MKVITFENYTLTADNYGRFDVTKRVTKTRKKKDDPQVKETYEGEDLVGYSTPISSIVTRIAHDKAVESDKVKTLVEYLKFMVQTIKSINLDA